MYIHCGISSGAVARLLPALVILAGCSPPKIKLLPVKGTITVGGAPMAGGMLTFLPDASRGNTSKEVPTGGIDAAGAYTVLSGGQEGAAAGWYKVTVTPGSFIDPRLPPPARPVAPPVPVPDRYTRSGTTDLAVEVVETPAAGAYDLKLSRGP